MSEPAARWAAPVAAHHGRADTGMVTLEAALAIPALVFIAVCCLGIAALGAEQIAVQADAVTAARSVARGESVQEGLGEGTRVQVTRSGSTESGLPVWDVRAQRQVRVIPPLGRWTLRVSADAVVVEEP